MLRCKRYGRLGTAAATNLSRLPANCSRKRPGGLTHPLSWRGSLSLEVIRASDEPRSEPSRCRNYGATATIGVYEALRDEIVDLPGVRPISSPIARAPHFGTSRSSIDWGSLFFWVDTGFLQHQSRAERRQSAMVMLVSPVRLELRLKIPSPLLANTPHILPSMLQTRRSRATREERFPRFPQPGRPRPLLTVIHVALMLRGAAGTFGNPLEINRSMLQFSTHDAT